MPDVLPEFQVKREAGVILLTLISADGMNRLTRQTVAALTETFEKLNSSSEDVEPVVLSGRQNFSAGADLNEVRGLTGPAAYEFSASGQRLMSAIANHSAGVVAAIEGHCMGGGLDLALACHRRIAAPGAVFGHRGAALGLITGWGGTQRLPRLIGKGRALQLFLTAGTLPAEQALPLGLIDEIADDPRQAARRSLLQDQRPVQESPHPHEI